ncbi:putative membrane protein YqjE [Flavobacterium sp. 7E]|uniref:hypothetical protein n=1 Tax=Flavobacterium sp. 7E TaxID=2735898 RepID=UPI00156D6995|nr:hypothetical protein [Flavobacterium sp. 7E]NRS90756.1 putative membrane protein YqjE [Flavobacterium sp. 7E]
MMLLFFILVIALLFFIYRKSYKKQYILLFSLSTFFFILIKINPDLNENYNLRQILYFIDRFDFNIFIILGLIIITLLILIIFDRTKKIIYRIILSIITIVGIFYLFAILLGINVFAIKEPSKNHFEGFVFDVTKKPLKGVKVTDGAFVKNYVLTDEKGFFKLDKKNEINNESNLVFTKKSYKDSVVVIEVENYHPPSSYFLFLRRETDTIRMIKLIKSEIYNP